MQQPQNVQTPQPLNLQTNLFSSEDLTELERIKTAAKKYVAAYNKKPARQGTFYGRSDQVSKLALANSLVFKLTTIHSGPNAQQLIIELGAIYVNINENKAYTGNTLFHPHSVLTQILEDTVKLFTKNLNPLEQLEAYSRGLELTHAEKKTGFLGLKSNQKAKHEISKNILTLFKDTLVNTETKITELKKAIKENKKATGPSWLHGSGKLEPILENLLKTISPPKKAKKPGTRLNKKSS